MLRLQFAITISEDFIRHRIEITRKFNSDWFPFTWRVVTKVKSVAVHVSKYVHLHLQSRLFWRLWRIILWSFSLLWTGQTCLGRFCHDEFCYSSIVISRSRSRSCNFRFSCCNNVHQKPLWSPLTVGLVGVPHFPRRHLILKLKLPTWKICLKPSGRVLFSLSH